MRVRNVATAAALALAMSACSSAQDASIGNFQQVLDEHFARECILVRPDGGIGVDDRQFPVTVELNPSNRHATAS